MEGQPRSQHRVSKEELRARLAKEYVSQAEDLDLSIASAHP